MSTEIKGHKPGRTLRLEPSVIDGADLFVGATTREDVWGIHVTRADFIAAVETELGVIVIDKAELPEVTHQERRGDCPWYGIGERHSRPVRHGEDASTIRAEGMRAIALAAHLEANPPVDPAKVEALVAMFKEVGGVVGISCTAQEHARRLLALGRIDVKEPS